MTAYFAKQRSLFSTTVTTNIGASGTGDTITLASVTGLPTDAEITLTFERLATDGTTLTPLKMERIRGTIVGSNLTSFTRAVEGTEQAHSSGAIVEYIPNAADWNNQVAGILVEHNQNGTHKPTDWISASDGATVTFALASGTKQKVTLGGNRTLALSGVTAGHVFILKLIQDATGSRTVTWFAGISWPDDTAPTLTTTAGAADIFGFIQTGTNTYNGFILGQNYAA